MKKEKLNYHLAKKLVTRSIEKLKNSNETFKDIFDISFSLFEDNILFLECGLIQKEPVTYKKAKDNIVLASKNIHKAFNELPKGSFVGIYLDNSPEWVYSFYAILMAGYKPYLVNTRNSDKQNEILFKELGIEAFISKHSIGSKKVLLTKELLVPNNEAYLPCWANEIALSTSGTSGKFTSVIYDGKSICEQLYNSYDLIIEQPKLADSYHGNIRHLLFLPLYHIFGLTAVFLWYSFFGRTFIIPKSLDSDSLKFAITYHEATHIFAVPIFWNKACKTLLNEVNKEGPKIRKKFEKGLQISIILQKIMPKFGLFIARNFLFKNVLSQMFGGSLKIGISGGGAIDEETLKIFNAIGYPLYNGYGMTEIGIVALERRKNIKYRLLGSVGKPFGSVSFLIHDEELFVKGNSLYSKMCINGKWIKRDLLAEYQTGDLVKKESENYYIQCRKDDLIITEGGENISPDYLLSYFDIPFCNQYTVIGLPSSNNSSEAALVYYIGKENFKLYEEKALFTIRNIIQKNNLPINRIIKSKCELPIVLETKVQRSVLKELLIKNKNDFEDIDISKVSSEISVKQFDDAILDKVLEIFRKEFPTKEVNENSNFTIDLGGDSISYYSILSELQNTFKFDGSNLSNVPQTPKEIAIYLSNEAKNW